MTNKFKIYSVEGENRFKFDGDEFTISRHDDHQFTNITASSDHGIFLFHEKNGGVEFKGVVEIHGSRTEPHITF